MNKAGKILDPITDKSIERVVKGAAKLAGFDETTFSGHSLRRGFITDAKKNGMDEYDIMQHHPTQEY
jgi:site-specific recombinase XerD